MSKMKSLAVPGGRIVHGQLIPHNPNYRRGVDAPDGFGRKFGQKTFATPAIHSGMTSKTRDAGNALAFVGGKRPLDDEPNTKACLGVGAPKAHPGMVSQQRPDGFNVGRHDPNEGDAILQDAGRRGAPPGGWR
jgi:hypothetical protein